MIDFLAKHYYQTKLEYGSSSEETVLNLQKAFQKHPNPPVFLHRREITALASGIDELVSFVEIPGVSEKERKHITEEIRNWDIWSFVKELLENSDAELLGDDELD